MATDRRRVVILGAGFAGLAACEALAEGPASDRFDILVVDRHTYNTFQPLLYQVATAGLNAGDIAYAIRSYLARHPTVTFRKATVAGVDFERREVLLEGTTDRLGYDYLVIATGATTNYFGVPGAREHTHAIYTMEDALAVRRHLADELERAESAPEADAELTVVVVGGGPTGVEMAGALAELRNVELRTTYRRIDPSRARVVLLEQRDRLLGAFDEAQAAYARRCLEDRRVEVRCSTTVAEVAADHVVLAGGEELPCSVVIWSAGVAAGPLAERLGCPTGPGGRILVGADLRLASHPEVFVVGDVAVPDPSGGAVVPQLAQPALQEGRHAGRQIERIERGEPTEPFVYADKGIMATIGRRAAVAELRSGLKLRGTAAWVAWLALHVLFLLGLRNRAAVLLNWGWRYLSWRRGAQVIAGPS